MSELLNHIKAENEKTLAWVNESPETRFASFLSEDLNHWSGYGIHTVEDFKRDSLISYISDTYKDIHGIRPRWMNLNEMSLAALEHEAENLTKEMVSVIDEHDTTVKNLCEQFNCTEEDLIRWEVI